MPEVFEELNDSSVWVITNPTNPDFQEEVIEIRSETTTIVDGALQGAQGPPGLDGESALEWRSESFVVASDGDQDFTLADTPKLGSVFVFFNGLYEQNFFVTDTLISLDDVNTIAGDDITIRYQTEV